MALSDFVMHFKLKPKQNIVTWILLARQLMDMAGVDRKNKVILCSHSCAKDLVATAWHLQLEDFDFSASCNMFFGMPLWVVPAWMAWYGTEEQFRIMDANVACETLSGALMGMLRGDRASHGS